jgi:hypothetical protein
MTIEEGVFETIAAKHKDTFGSQWTDRHVADLLTRKWETDHHMGLLTVSEFRTAWSSNAELKSSES